MEPDLHTQQQQQQRVHSVVIITLPPSDDPSKGKTISAFTLTDHEIQPEEENPNPSFQPDPLHQNLWFSDLSMNSPRLVLCLLGLSLLAIAFYGSVFPNSVQMFRVSSDESDRDRDRDRDRDDDNNRRETTSFVFPVYHKLSARREIPERNLAQVLGLENEIFVDSSIDQELVNPVKVNDVFTATTIFPVGGNVYPNGYALRFKALKNLKCLFCFLKHKKVKLLCFVLLVVAGSISQGFLWVMDITFILILILEVT